MIRELTKMLCDPFHDVKGSRKDDKNGSRGNAFGWIVLAVILTIIFLG